MAASAAACPKRLRGRDSDADRGRGRENGRGCRHRARRPSSVRRRRGAADRAGVGLLGPRPGARVLVLAAVLQPRTGRVAGRTRKMVKSIVHGRNVLVGISEPLLARGSPRLGTRRRPTRRWSGSSRGYCGCTSASAAWPPSGRTRSHRRMLIDLVLGRSRRAPRHHQGERRGAPQARPRAHPGRRSTPARSPPDVSYPTVRMLQRPLTRLWTELYDGVQLDGLERLRGVADGREIVYVPCHRSHIDYLPALLPPLQQRLLAAARGRRGQPEPALLRRHPAPRRCLLPAPQLRGEPLVRRRLQRLPQGDTATRALARVLHRGRAQPHRAPAAAQGRHARHDGARLPARSAHAAGVRADLLRLRASAGRLGVHERAVGRQEAERDRLRAAESRSGSCARTTAACT